MRACEKKLTRQDVVEWEEAGSVAAVERDAGTAEGGRLSAGRREDELERPLTRRPADHSRVYLIHEHGTRLTRRAPAPCAQQQRKNSFEFQQFLLL